MRRIIIFSPVRGKGCLLLCPPSRHDIAHIASSFHASLALAFFYPTPKIRDAGGLPFSLAW
ncbi:TPA: hypothetical protein ACQVHM_001606, partial [Serratia marcescens]